MSNLHKINNKIIRDIKKETFLRNYHNNLLQDKIESDAFYGIIANDQRLFNPLKDLPDAVDNDISKLLFYYMQNPDYFYLAMRVLLNMEGSFPLQCLILKNLYKYRFPILVGSRGLGKCVTADTWLITDHGFKQMKDLVPSEEIGIQQPCPYKVRGVNEYQDVAYSFFDGTKDTIRIRTSAGVWLEGSHEHPVMIVNDDGKREWKKLKDIKLFDKIYEDYRWEFYDHTNDVTEDDARQYFRDYMETGQFNDKLLAAPKDAVVTFCRLFMEHSSYCATKVKYSPKSDYDNTFKVYLLFNLIGISAKITHNKQRYYIVFARSDMRNFAYFHGFESALYKKLVKKKIYRKPDNLRFREVMEIEASRNKVYDVYIDSDDHSFFTNGIVSHNSYTMAIYAILRMILSPGSKIVITGTGFRQSKIIFEYMDGIYQKAPVLRSCFSGESKRQGPSRGNDSWSFRIGDSIAYALPVGPDGSKIRGMRANILMCDEFSSMNRSIFEEVMSGFLAVKPDPIKQLKVSARDSFLKDYGLLNPDMIEDDLLKNQLIISGTAYYKFNHFYEYFNKWRNIIYSGGREEKLQEIFGEDYNREEVNWKDYCVMRIPVDKIRSGYIDMDQINRIKASSSRDVFNREFMCLFTDDSDGFFRRTLIESCVANEKNNIQKNGEQIVYSPQLFGDPGKKYVYGVDPAYQGDNFAIVIIELCEGYRKIVYVWTTQANEHKMKLKQGLVSEDNYYQYCVRKIRNLMRIFPCAAIGLDSGGGGQTIMEVFRETDRLETNEQAILPVIDMTSKPKETDLEEGEHILHMINFSSQWNTESNHALKKDLETKDILFPEIDSVSYTEADFYDKTQGKTKYLEDTMGDCLTEVEELKKEMGNIFISETSTGKQRFDTAKVGQGGSSSSARKDRYSALLIANWVARDNSADLLQTRQIFGTPRDYFSNMHSYYNKNLYVGDSPLAKQLSKFYEDEQKK